MTRHPFKMKPDLESLRNASEAAWGALAKIPQEIKTGNPGKRQAAAVTLQAGKYYEILTGMPPYRLTVDGINRGHQASGIWLRFLSDVFKALEIDARPEAQTKAAQKKTRKK